MENNPFAAPVAKTIEQLVDDELVHPEASNGKRFWNYIIDLFFIYLSIFLVVMGINLDPVQQSYDTGFFDNLIGIVFMFGFYLLFEGLFGRTPGKWITGCLVVNQKTYQKAGFGQIALRCLCRMIPFEHFSFFRTEPGGWHDSLSKTRTIDIRAEKVNRVDYENFR